MNDVIEGRYAYSAWRAATKGETCPASEHLPTGLGGVEGHPQPGLYRKRDGGGYVDGKKQAHQWVPVKIYLTDDAGQVQHRWRPGLKVCAYVGQNQEADPYKIWLWCQKTVNGVATLNAITQDQYNFWMQNGQWPDDAPSTEVQPEPVVVDAQVGTSTAPAVDTVPAGIGHNSEGDPEGVDALVTLLKQHDASITEWLKVERNGEAAANKAANWLGDLRGVERRVKDRYKIEKAPILEAERQFKAKWDPVTTLMEAVKARISRAYEGIARREKERRQQVLEVEAKAVAAAHRAKLEAERAALEEQRRREHDWAAAKPGAKAEEIPPKPEPLPPLPEAAPIVVEPVKVSFGGSTGRKVSLKTARHAEIDDWQKAAVHYAMSPRLQEIVQKLATADAKNGIACPGARIVEREVAA